MLLRLELPLLLVRHTLNEKEEEKGGCRKNTDVKVGRKLDTGKSREGTKQGNKQGRSQTR